MSKSIEKFLHEFSDLQSREDIAIKEPEILEYSEQKSYEIRDINSYISEQQRERITKVVFRNKPEKYQIIVNLFNRLKTWDDAQELLKMVFRSNRLNPNSKVVKEFTTIVYNCFGQNLFQ